MKALTMTDSEALALQEVLKAVLTRRTVAKHDAVVRLLHQQCVSINRDASRALPRGQTDAEFVDD